MKIIDIKCQRVVRAKREGNSRIWRQETLGKGQRASRTERVWKPQSPSMLKGPRLRMYSNPSCDGVSVRLSHLSGPPQFGHAWMLPPAEHSRGLSSLLAYISKWSYSGINPSRKLTTPPDWTVLKKSHCLLGPGPEVTRQRIQLGAAQQMMPLGKRKEMAFSGLSLSATLHLPFCLLSWP